MITYTLTNSKGCWGKLVGIRQAYKWAKELLKTEDEIIIKVGYVPIWVLRS